MSTFKDTEMVQSVLRLGLQAGPPRVALRIVTPRWVKTLMAVLIPSLLLFSAAASWGYSSYAYTVPRENLWPVSGQVSYVRLFDGFADVRLVGLPNTFSTFPIGQQELASFPKVGDEVTIWTNQVPGQSPDGAKLNIWELRQGQDMVITYEATEETRRGQRVAAASLAVFTLGLAFLSVLFLIRNRG